MKKLSMEVVNAHAAGIDVGSRFHMVAVNQNSDDVKKFGVYTEDYDRMSEYLRSEGITSVAMESTGNYWQTLFSALQIAGFEVMLVNGQQTKNMKGKKTDVQDCIWIQKLHSLGLLTGSFLPGCHTGQLRTYYNHRQYLIDQTSKYINKMQKALRLMNIRLDVALNDITGKSGRAIIDAILSGQRDAQQLAALVDGRVKKSKEEIAKSLHGNWREDLLFELKECLSLYDVYQAKIMDCDQQLKKVLESIQGSQCTMVPLPKLPCKKQRTKHSPLFDVQGLAYKHFGVDLFAIPALSYNTILCLITNISREELHKFPTVKNFTNWLRLAPNNKKTGGKIISSRTPKGKNKIALALRQAANSIGNMKNHPLLSFFQRVAYKNGRAAAITATARKLAAIIYHMIIKQQPYQPMSSETLNSKIKTQQIKNIKRRLEKLSLNKQEMDTLFSSLSLSTA
jgi:transposase